MGKISVVFLALLSSVTVLADNITLDPGQAYQCTGPGVTVMCSQAQQPSSSHVVVPAGVPTYVVATGCANITVAATFGYANATTAEVLRMVNCPNATYLLTRTLYNGNIFIDMFDSRDVIPVR